MSKAIKDDRTFWALLKGLKDCADEVWLDEHLRVRMKLGTTTFCPVTFLANILADEPPANHDDFEAAFEALGMDVDFAWDLWQCIEKQYPYDFSVRQKLLEVLELGEFAPPIYSPKEPLRTREMVEAELVGDVLDSGGQW